MANTWNQSGTTWNTGRWGTTDPIVTGWGAKSWNEPGTTWNDLGDQEVDLTSPGAITASLGTVSITTEINKGWGQDTWGNETWGESGMLVELTGPDPIQSNVSANAWNDASWGEGQGWGIFSLEVADVMGLTGVSSTGSVGSPTIIGNVSFSITGVSATSSVGSVTVADQAMGLTGQAITSAVGSLSPADVMGLTGQQATASVAAFGTASGFGIQAYQAVDTGSNSSYTDVATGSNTSYSDAA